LAATARKLQSSFTWRCGISANILERKLVPDAPVFLNTGSGAETILLLSRDIDTRILIRNVFFNRGYLVLEAADEQHAAVVCSQMRGKVDLIITDGASSQGDGWGQWRQRTPKILMLLDSMPAQIDTVTLGPEVEYLKKPFTAEEIILKVQSILDSHKHKKKIVIVDDDESVRRMVAALLTAAGYQVTEASNGREVLSRAAMFEADVILTEIVMPEVEGLQLIRDVLHLNPRMKIVAMSGADRAETYLAVARSLGAKATLTKPLNAEELLRILRQVSNPQ
jgi:DNA-binding response OmpR family regulator